MDFHIFQGYFALLWLCPNHNAELFVPILVWGHCAIFTDILQPFFMKAFSFCLELTELLYLQLLLQDSLWDQL